MRAIGLMIMAALALLAAACSSEKTAATPAEPALPPVEQMTREALLTYLHQQLAMDKPDRKPNEDFREKNRRSYFGCLEQFKNDECRFMRCSPYALYAADEFYLGGAWDDAFKYYTAAFDLIKEEVASTIEKQNKWRAEYEPKEKTGQATEQDTRHYLFRICTTSQRLYHNHAEIARILLRYALVFERQQKSAEAANAKAQAEEFIKAAADAYVQYFAARGKLTPLLNPNDPKQVSFYFAALKETDQLLPIRHL